MTEEEIRAIVAAAVAEAMAKAAPAAAAPSPVATPAAPMTEPSSAEKLAEAQAVIDQNTKESQLIDELTNVVTALRTDITGVGDWQPAADYDAKVSAISNTEDKIKLAYQQFLIGYSFAFLADKKPLDQLESEINAMPLDVLRDRYRQAREAIVAFKQNSSVKGVSGPGMARQEANAMEQWITGEEKNVS